MSIIYDALRKVEDKLDLTGKKNIAVQIKRAAKKRPYYFYLLIIATGLTLASVTYNVVTKYYPARVSKIGSSEYAQAKLGLDLTLNGIVFSGDTNYALINNQIVKEGDMLLGATIKRISSEVVELVKNGVVVRLSNRK
jgi:hypothetical protein